jgi:hypothetical protein
MNEMNALWSAATGVLSIATIVVAMLSCAVLISLTPWPRPQMPFFAAGCVLGAAVLLLLFLTYAEKYLR